MPHQVRRQKRLHPIRLPILGHLWHLDHETGVHVRSRLNALRLHLIVLMDGVVFLHELVLRVPVLSLVILFLLTGTGQCCW